jgi:hypothetical protein
VASLAYGLGTSACGKLGLWTSACGLLGLQPYISVGQALVETGIGTDFKIANRNTRPLLSDSSVETLRKNG